MKFEVENVLHFHQALHLSLPYAFEVQTSWKMRFNGWNRKDEWKLNPSKAQKLLNFWGFS